MKSLVARSAPISVVIPALNAEAFIEEAIRSAQNQTLSVAEIIVVADDCSDRTKAIASDLGARVFEHNRRNMSVGLNIGIHHSMQPWIALLDADDYWHPDKIALQWEAIENFPDVGLISCDHYVIYPHVVASASQRELRERWQNVETVINKGNCYYVERADGGFMTRFFIDTPTAVLRREVFSTIGLFDESLSHFQTFEFFARVLARYPLAFIQQPLVYSRVHDQNHTREMRGWTSHLAVVDRMLKHPEQYAPGAGQAHRKYLKRDFLLAERILARAEIDAVES
jgi:glycosyltransferase involved in cell wall biosynthesis